MNKLLFAALCFVSLQASAQKYGIGAGYERDFATSNTRGLEYVEKTSIIGGTRTEIGQFDGGIYEVHVKGNRFQDTQQGIEIGYGNSMPIGTYTLAGRVAAGKVFNRGLGAPETGYYNTYAVTASKPITKQLSVSLTGRYRPQRDFDEQKQYSVGVGYFITKTTVLQGSFRHTRSTGPILNGFSTTVLHYF